MDPIPEEISRDQRARDHAGVYVPPPLLYVLAFVGGIILHRTVGQDRFPSGFAVPLRASGLVIAVLGVFLATSARILFKKAGTSVLLVRPTTAVVTTGPYRFTRNPMYLGMSLVYLGLTLIVGYGWLLVGLALAILVMDRLVISREERYLEDKFGDRYRGYRDSARRWL